MPGEKIWFGAEVDIVDNQSSRVMTSSFLQLVETVSPALSNTTLISNTQVTYHAATLMGSKTRTEPRVLAELRRGGVGPGSTDYWDGVTLRVPALPPTKLASTRCTIIDVQYQLAFHVEPSGMGFDLVVGII